MAMTVIGDVIVPEILDMAVQAEFKDGKAFLGSGMVSNGAVVVKDNFGESGQDSIGLKVSVPYWGALGSFVSNPDGSSVTPQKIQQVKEEGAVARESLAVQASRWTRGAGTYEELARQLGARATDRMDKLIIAKATEAIPSMTKTITAGSQLNWDGAIEARSYFGDSAADIAAMCIHSYTEYVLTKERATTTGVPLLVDPVTGRLKMIGSMPVVVSDAMPVVATAGSITPAGTTPPTVTVAGTANRNVNFRMECTSIAGGAALTQWTGRYSTDGGGSWIAFTSAASVTVNDSYLSQNDLLTESTGLTLTIAAGNAAVNNVWTFTTTNRYTSLIAKKNALAFWFNRNALIPKSQPDVLSDSEITASHLYHVTHRYRRVPGSNKPGVVLVVHS